MTDLTEKRKIALPPTLFAPDNERLSAQELHTSLLQIKELSMWFAQNFKHLDGVPDAVDDPGLTYKEWAKFHDAVESFRKFFGYSPFIFRAHIRVADMGLRMLFRWYTLHGPLCKEPLQRFDVEKWLEELVDLFTPRESNNRALLEVSGRVGDYEADEAVLNLGGRLMALTTAYNHGLLMAKISTMVGNEPKNVGMFMTMAEVIAELSEANEKRMGHTE